jgi:predicted enzyme related to lactoylglutathione lyase
VELTGVPDAGDVATELGWLTRTPGEPSTLFDADFDGTSRLVAGSLAEGPVKGWMPYFAVSDIEEAAATAPELGGTVIVPPTIAPLGLVTSIADPAGTVATLLQSPTAWGGTRAGS